MRTSKLFGALAVICSVGVLTACETSQGNHDHSAVNLTPPFGERLVAAKIASGYRSMSNPDGSSRAEPHNGVDLLLPAGTRIASNVSGTVVAVGSNPYFGQYVKVRWAASQIIIVEFSHLEDVFVKVGEVVSIGETVLGTISRSPGFDHLHWGVSGKNTDGSWRDLDPTEFIFSRLLCSIASSSS